jgi:hypothetical protein
MPDSKQVDTFRSAPIRARTVGAAWLAVHMIETDAMGAPIEVADLDPEWLLALAQDAATECWKPERRRLRLAAQWCVLHPATEESGFVTSSADGIAGRNPSGDGATTAPPRAATSGPDPKARPTSSRLRTPSPSHRTESRQARPPTRQARPPTSPITWPPNRVIRPAHNCECLAAHSPTNRTTKPVQERVPPNWLRPAQSVNDLWGIASRRGEAAEPSAPDAAPKRTFSGGCRRATRRSRRPPRRRRPA